MVTDKHMCNQSRESHGQWLVRQTEDQAGRGEGASLPVVFQEVRLWSQPEQS